MEAFLVPVLPTFDFGTLRQVYKHVFQRNVDEKLRDHIYLDYLITSYEKNTGIARKPGRSKP